jgi:DNA-binding transcriptional MerR regulator
VLLIRIRTLAEAGVPLARVQQLLAAAPEEFGEAVDQVDAELRARIRELQEHRRRVARLAAGDSLALPPEVVDYLATLRASGASEAAVAGERDAWILVAARWPDRIAEFMVEKSAQLDDPRTVRMYRLISGFADGDVDEEQLVALADVIAEMAEQSAQDGGLEQQRREMDDDVLVDLLDSFASEAHPLVERLKAKLVERGWTGWIRMERSGARGPDAVAP